MSCVPEETGVAEPWVARADMGSACVALLREGPGPDEDIIQPPTLQRRMGEGASANSADRDIMCLLHSAGEST